MTSKARCKHKFRLAYAGAHVTTTICNKCKTTRTRWVSPETVNKHLFREFVVNYKQEHVRS